MPRTKTSPADAPPRPPSPSLSNAGGTSKSILSVVMLGVLAILGGILLYLWPQMRLVDLGYRQGKLRAARQQALQHRKELEVELATLRRLSRIEKIAVTRLGMQPPQLSQVIYVRSESSASPGRRTP